MNMNVNTSMNMHDLFDKVVEYDGTTYYLIEIFDGYALVTNQNPTTAKFPLQTLVLPWPIRN